MSLSDICAQQHAHEQNNLKRLLLWGLLGSLGVHGIALSLSQFKLWQDPPDEVTPIELMVAEPHTTPISDTTEPVDLSTRTNDPAAPTASAPPRTTVAAPIEPVALDQPEPLEASQAESAWEEPQPTETPSESVRDLLQRLRDARAGTGNTTNAPASPSATAGGGSVPNASGGASAGDVATRSATSGRGQGQGSRTVACQNCVRPNYPQSALAAGVEGTPRVSVDINPDGSVRSVTLIRSSGNAAIDQAVMRAARRSRFQPIAGGASVPIDYDLSIEGSRRHRDARRRGERQAVDLPTTPTATPETAGPPPAEASSPTTPTPPVAPEAVAPAPRVAEPDPAPAAAPTVAPAAPSINEPAPEAEPPASPSEL